MTSYLAVTSSSAQNKRYGVVLTAGRRHWLTDRAIAGEPIDDTTVMLTIGTTFQ